ncbi:hypothetical protein [Anoxybacteroides tepidamans]|uniref:hypothetical protein n=1 Tax=Anoxybacteroides tepidamans TaxID=265948 RepID=UPI00048516E2|nr:hypothetical protein [Anoxybacillus tepidamans]
MDQHFINNENVTALKQEVHRLKERIAQLEEQILFIQQKCQHAFFETPSIRKCVKCQYVESLHY